jgi:hypothetical protein
MLRAIRRREGRRTGLRSRGGSPGITSRGYGFDPLRREYDRMRECPDERPHAGISHGEKRLLLIVNAKVVA